MKELNPTPDSLMDTDKPTIPTEEELNDEIQQKTLRMLLELLYNTQPNPKVTQAYDELSKVCLKKKLLRKRQTKKI